MQNARDERLLQMRHLALKSKLHPFPSVLSYMQKIIFAALCLGALLGVTVSAQTAPAAPAAIGQPAPNFTLQGSDGKKHSLAHYKGKYVVLEWTNPQCPFVHKFYDSHTMQGLQKKETAKGVVWLRINSNAEGHEGYQSPSDLAAYVKEQHVAATASLIDPTGKVGHMYGARTTPHMFVIDPKGVLIYAGGIDNKPSTNVDDIATATNYVTAALDESMAGKPVTTPSAPPYGCAVKYASN
jgi:peroxiredoxin